MLKKEVLSISMFILILLMQIVASADVAYIIKNTRNADQGFLSLFHDMNLSVDLISSTLVKRTDFTKYSLIFIGDELFRNPEDIPVMRFPTIISNFYHTDTWGLTDFDGASKLASNSPLNVKKGSQIIQVYTQAFFREGSSFAIPYYFLDDNNRLKSSISAARTYTGNNFDFGDVISHIPAGARLKNGKVSEKKACFFGIIESTYWTEQAKQLFMDCVNFVQVIVCSQNSDCGNETSQLICLNSNLTEETTKSVCINPGRKDSFCKQEQSKKLIEQCSNSCENGQCIGQCSLDSDCGPDSFSENFCRSNSLFRNKTSSVCTNSTCSSQTTEELVENCSGLCRNGQCQDIICSKDSDCNDNNPKTKDQCINPGTAVAECRNTPLNCNSDFDCGFTGFFGTEFCTQDNAFKKFQNASCHSPGTLNSFCTIEVKSNLIDECSFSCIGTGICIRCNENSDCNDNNTRTKDTCVLPSTQESHCQNV